MAIEVACVCGKQLDRPGALVFSPPSPPAMSDSGVIKYHVCGTCWTLVLGLFHALRADVADRP